MPQTQAYTLSWAVKIQPEGDVSEDVSEITIIQEDGKPDSATVTLDTTQRPHALKEQKAIDIEVTDGNETITFDGFTDSVQDDEEQPIVTVDARESDGLLQDTTAVGIINADSLFGVIDGIIDSSAGKVREITFDQSNAESEYGTFASTTTFGKVNIAHFGQFDVNEDTFDQFETVDEGKEAELRINTYFNTTSSTYVATVTGKDADGTTVEASFDLPPGDSVTDAYGTDTFKLALSGGNKKWAEVNSVSTNVPDFSGSRELSMDAKIFNYVKTDWRFRAGNLLSVNDAIERIVRYISGLDSANDWIFTVNDSDELIVKPEETGSTTTHIFREGDNVLKPVANRDLDGVRNFIKVSGSGNVNVWLWAYKGKLYWSLTNPFDDPPGATYPDSGVQFDSGQATQNHIENINLRAESLSSNTFTSNGQALDIGKKALRQYLRTPVSGQAPVPGIHPADVGDEAEVYYPSRGIPGSVDSNIFDVKKVEYSITPEKAVTTVDFGTSKRNLGDVIGSGGGLVRNDIDSGIRQFSDREGSGGGIVAVGELDEQNDDGTWTVIGEDGNTYENVRVI